MKRYLSLFVVGVLFVLAVFAGFWKLPYYALGPGPAREVEPLIKVSGHPTYGSSGKLIMTTVAYYQATPLTALEAWLNPDKTLVPTSTFLGGQSAQQEHVRAISEMDQSKIDASVVALTALTNYPKDAGTGALVEATLPGCPADGKLFAGDLVTQIDGKPIASRQAASDAIDAVPPGKPIVFTITAVGQTHRLTLTRAMCPAPFDKRPYVGVTLIENFPFGIQISSGDIGGPSAGLMYALGLYNVLTPGDLTGGRTIAGTGTISMDGTVGPIGGIADKVVAARHAGASIFLVPKQNMTELQGVDTGTMKLVPVGTFQDALTALGVPAVPSTKTKVAA